MTKTMRDRLSDRFRTNRDGRLRDTIRSLPRTNSDLSILDLGGRFNYWKRVGYEFLVDNNVHITIQNLHESEIVRDPAAPEGLFDWAVGNACSLDYDDNAFDFCHSNSVIEHVGLWRDMQDFASETRRVARSYYVQTPNFWFPIEPHFVSFPMNHWLPRPMRAGLMRKMKLAAVGKAKDVGKAYDFVDSARLLTVGQMRFLFPESTIAFERLALLTKSIIAIRVDNGRSKITNTSQKDR